MIKLTKKIFLSLTPILFTLPIMSASCVESRNDNNEQQSGSEVKKQKNRENIDHSNTFKWGHWNITNFTGNRNQNDKTTRIALLANEAKFDILGLTEVLNANGVEKIVNKMNELSNSNMYSYIASKKLNGSMFKKKNGNSRDNSEHVAIIYNKNRFDLEKFSTNEVGYSYTDKFNDFLGNNAEYARPPYGVKFKFKEKPDKKMTVVFAHFDSPGVSRTNRKLGEKKMNGIGIFEYREAKQLFNVLEHFDKIGNKEGNIFFGGDTNIGLGKQNIAFDWLTNGNDKDYKSVFEDSENNKTSLGKNDTWSEPYDKMFYKTNWKLVTKEIFDIYKIINDQKIKTLFKKHKVEIKKISDIRKGTVLSDHTFTSATFEIQ
ncbi:endonuclease/exonuclease/phosphatase family protein [Metamycoplasma alkalescens]|uniref:Endonuclease/Exonuclease/phosphatase family protein n=3 Tax=Metamycoplasma alkalescens TaxID=45363 RepID=A0A318U5R1_9BACT|nr:endonuclease/exonuclease/phosphatase family protein [Metamycoplasma alkalescens]PYF43728.1 Endonuclease/Exonuclease/phosphatase family protein [Metamycoplasma alkalescens]